MFCVLLFTVNVISKDLLVGFSVESAKGMFHVSLHVLQSRYRSTRVTQKDVYQ